MKMTFELTNEGSEKWIDIEFVESDPCQDNQKVCEIVLCVDWGAQNAVVETRMDTNYFLMRELNKLDQCVTLPKKIDASLFVEYYNKTIKPLLEERGKKFESYWDGSNLVGRFQTDEDDDRFFDETEINIQDACDKAPEHDKYIYFSIGDSLDYYSDIIDILECADIDFMTADLEDDSVIELIMDRLNGGECVFLNNDNKTDFINIRKSIIESRSGEDES
jgi:hypothetical protein